MNCDLSDSLVRGKTREQLATDSRQHSVRKNRIDHSSAALDLSAAFGDELQHIIRIREWNLVVLLDALLNPFQLQADDLVQHLIGQREERNRHDATEER